MKYNKIIILKDNRECCLRNGNKSDGQAVYENFNLTLEKKSESENEVQIIAVVDGVVAGTAGIEAVGGKYKVRHRAEFGVGVARAFWGMGIGHALMDACIECAGKAGYVQLELNVVAGNTRAVSMYEKAGFVEYGRNPKGFNSRISGFQEIIYMKLEL